MSPGAAVGAPSCGAHRLLRRVALGALTVAIAAALPPARAPGEQQREQLSNERTVTTWAYVKRKAAVRRRPGAGRDVVARITRATEDRTRELVIALRQRTVNRGHWTKVRFPNRGPNTGWIRRRHLHAYRTVDTRLEIDRATFMAKLFRAGEKVWQGRVGVGKPEAPTPSGKYYVRNRLTPAEENGIYGAFAFGTSAYSNLSDWPRGGVVGIHGTNQPDLIPGRISHGCVRLKNHKVKRLRRLMPLGTPIRIR